MKQPRSFATLVSSLLVSASLLSCGSSATSVASRPDTSRWAWLGEDGGTYWYVPPENLQAIRWNADAPSDATSIEDQTVWHIERYDNGYFFGPVVVKLASSPLNCQYLIGSVTPDGRVYISFNALQSTPRGDPALTTGTGAMVQQRGAWTFNMQMASGSSSTHVAHWAFMLQCTPDQPCWNDVPGTGQSISELLAQCE